MVSFKCDKCGAEISSNKNFSTNCVHYPKKSTSAGIEAKDNGVKSYVYNNILERVELI